MTEYNEQLLGKSIDTISLTVWHIERKINNILKRLEAIEAALLGLQDDPEGHAPNLEDDDWAPDRQQPLHRPIKDVVA